jgi:hypothetical protein
VSVTGQSANLRAGPGTVYGIEGQLKSGDQLPLLGRTADGLWYQVQDRGRFAWISASLVSTNRSLADIPVVTDLPPTPTATATSVPTRTPTPTATPPPTWTPTPVGPLVLSHNVIHVACLSETRYRIVFGLEVKGGTGWHTVYRDVEDQVVYGPGGARTFEYLLEWGAGSAAVGTFRARSRNQVAESKFYVPPPNCQGHK